MTGFEGLVRVFFQQGVGKEPGGSGRVVFAVSNVSITKVPLPQQGEARLG